MMARNDPAVVGYKSSLQRGFWLLETKLFQLKTENEPVKDKAESSIA